MWRYFIREGELWLSGILVARRLYSGSDDGDGLVEPGEGMNDPSMTGQRRVGPIPPGHYIIGPAFEHSRTGALTMRILPKSGTDMHGRDGFLFHRGSPGGGHSQGCIVAPVAVLEVLAKSPYRDLEVLAERPRLPESTPPGNVA